MHCPSRDGSIFFTAKSAYTEYVFKLLMHCIKTSGKHLQAAVQLFVSFSVNFYFDHVIAKPYDASPYLHLMQ